MAFFSRTIPFIAVALIFGCTTAYQSKPLAFKHPDAYGNATRVAGTTVGAEAYHDRRAASETFGFDVIGAGMLPVMVVVDNRSGHTFQIAAEQSFLEDAAGNLWPVLGRKVARERATRYSRTGEVLKGGATGGLWGAAAGGLVGAAVGVVGGSHVGEALGKGAAMGAAAGAVLGGADGYGRDQAGQTVEADMAARSIENVAIAPGNLAHGLLFFPAEAEQARILRLQLRQTTTGTAYTVKLFL
ncbi:MAG: hypothetical protein PHV70_01580 [Desulfobacteraceae bacterium]|nr:hypothetical protein [Desulfobacteraceae bacterium]